MLVRVRRRRRARRIVLLRARTGGFVPILNPAGTARIVGSSTEKKKRNVTRSRIYDRDLRDPSDES